MGRVTAMGRVFLATWICLTALSSLWSLATPLSAAPDEPAHLIKAASVARGELIGVESENGHNVLVPEAIAFSHSLTCFAFSPQSTAACAPATPSGNDLVEAPTTAGLYNPLYYAIVGAPSLFVDGTTAIYMMRIVSAALTSALLALGMMIIASWKSRLLPTLGMLAAATPLAIFVGGVVNPSGPEMAGVLTATIAAYSLARRPDNRFDRQRVVVLAVSASVAMNMRGISPLWVGIAVLLCCLAAQPGVLKSLSLQPFVRTAATLTALAGAVALVWTGLTNSLGSAIEDGAVETDYPGAGTPPLIGFMTVVSRTFSYGRGMIAEFGWADTLGSDATLFVLSALIGSILMAGFVLLRRRELLVFVTALAALVFVPALVQASYVTQGGYIWQGRYTAPMLAVLLFLTMALISEGVRADSYPRLANRLLSLVTVLWAFTQLDSFVQVLGRYATGAPVAWREFLLAPEWAPPGGIIVLSSALTLAVAVSSVLIWRYARSEASDEDSSLALGEENLSFTK